MICRYPIMSTGLVRISLRMMALGVVEELDIAGRAEIQGLERDAAEALCRPPEGLRRRDRLRRGRRRRGGSSRRPGLDRLYGRLHNHDGTADLTIRILRARLRRLACGLPGGLRRPRLRDVLLHVSSRNPDEDIEHRAREYLRHGVWRERVRDLLHRQVVDRAPEVLPALHDLVELARQVSHDARAAHISPRHPLEFVTNVPVEEGQQDSRQVADELVKGGGLQRADLVVVGPDAIQDRVSGLVGDDIMRQAGIDRLVFVTEVVEPERLAVPVVAGVRLITSVRHHDQPVAVEAPWHRAAERLWVLVELQHPLHHGPHVQSLEVRVIDGVLDERAVGCGVRRYLLGTEFLIFGRLFGRDRQPVPVRRLEPAAGRIPGDRFVHLSWVFTRIDHRDARAGRAVAEPRLKTYLDLLHPEERLVLRQQRVLDEDRDLYHQAQALPRLLVQEVIDLFQARPDILGKRAFRLQAPGLVGDRLLRAACRSRTLIRTCSCWFASHLGSF